MFKVFISLSMLFVAFAIVAETKWLDEVTASENKRLKTEVSRLTELLEVEAQRHSDIERENKRLAAENRNLATSSERRRETVVAIGPGRTQQCNDGARLSENGRKFDELLRLESDAASTAKLYCREYQTVAREMIDCYESSDDAEDAQRCLRDAYESMPPTERVL